MATKKEKANDPQEEKKGELLEPTPLPEGASEDKVPTNENPSVEEVTESENKEKKKSSEKESEVEESIDFSKLDFTELLVELNKRVKAQNWYTEGKNIQEITNAFNSKFKVEIQEKKEAFIDEGGNEIDFYFKPNYKNDFDQIVREYKKNKRTFYQEREQSQKLNLDRKQEIIEGIKELIGMDENINSIYRKFKNLQESWHKTGPVPRPQSNNIWQTYKHHTEIFYDFLHLNRELRDLDFKHNYEEKIKIIEQAEALAEIPDVLKASRDLNILHRLWKNDLGPVAKEHREELWTRFQAASQLIHNRRQEFDKEYDNILEDNLKQKNTIMDQLMDIKKNLPKNHNEWRKTIDLFNKKRIEFQSIGQVPKSQSKSSWASFRELCREINREKNKFYKSHKADQKNNINLKKELINEVKEILESEDWDSFTNRMKNIQKDWKEIGFVPRKFSNELWEEFRSLCNLFFERLKSGYQKINEEEEKSLKKKDKFIKGIEKLEIPLETEAFKSFFDGVWEEYNLLGKVSGDTNTKNIESFKKKFISLIDATEMEKSVKNEAQNYVSFFMLKNDDNELSREIQNIKKAIEELRSETRQLENNLDYFSNTSNDNPLFQDVTSRLNDLNTEIDNHKEKLVGLRKFKREIEARDAISSEENKTQSEEENTTEE